MTDWQKRTRGDQPKGRDKYSENRGKSSKDLTRKGQALWLPADQDNTPRLWTIMDEAALLRIVGSPEIMRVQREHLVKMAQRPNITIQVIPFSEGATCAYGRAFTILTSNNGSAVVYLEDLINAHYVRTRDEVAQFSLKFDHLRTNALTDDKSLRLIKG